MSIENPSAFPFQTDATMERYNSMKYGETGMTLRDYFAAKVLQGLCANPGGPFQRNEMSGWDIVNCKYEDIVKMAYGIADTMLAERSKS